VSRATPLHKDAQKFCRYHIGKDCFAPFTGQDSPAWTAFVYLLECYSHGGGDEAITAMRATIRCAQLRWSVLSVFVQAIPAVMDWGDVARLWPRLVEPIEHDINGQDIRALYAIERTEAYRGGSNKVEVIVWRHGLGQDPRSLQAQQGAAR
jgi:hypothetical protein